MSEDEMAGRYHQGNGHELGQTSVDGEGLRGLMCCSPQGRRVGHSWVTEQQQHIYMLTSQHIYMLTKSYTDDKIKAEN